MASGAFASSAAEPFVAVPNPMEFAAIPPPTLEASDPLAEPAELEGGSGDLSPQSAQVPPPDLVDDPWAEAFSASRLGAVVSAGTASPAYPLVLNPHIQQFVDRFTGSRREVIALWFSRSGRYMEMIRGVLRSQGLPEELAFTAMVESGLNPVAVSRAGAKGLWQFMAATARRYGLRVDRWVDERLDPEKSTVAAAAYLRDLYNLFGSWPLAQAAYNAGELKVARALRLTQSTDFWALTRTKLLQQETKDFVPQIHALTIIGLEPGRYGFVPADESPSPVDRVLVPPSTDLRRLSASTGVAVDILRSLNTALVRGVTPPDGRYEVKVPAGARSTIVAALAPRPARTAVAAVAKEPRRAARRHDVHVVRPRDTVTGIARRYGVSVDDVLRWNGLGMEDRIRPGDRLQVAGARVGDREGRGGFR